MEVCVGKILFRNLEGMEVGEAEFEVADLLSYK